MRSKPDLGLAFAGALFLVAGAIFLWSGLSGLLYHTRIYFKGPSWVDPRQAVIGGSLLAGLGLFLIAISFRNNRGDDQHQP
jgi:putative Mn2+ efflux pump MntP